jgi:hypothetical protein
MAKARNRLLDFNNLTGILPEGCNPVLQTGSGMKSRVTKCPLFWKAIKTGLQLLFQSILRRSFDISAISVTIFGYD